MNDISQSVEFQKWLFNYELNGGIVIHPAIICFGYLVQVIANIIAGAVFREDSTKAYTYVYLQPAPFTFSIWGLIYASQFIFCLAQFWFPSIRYDTRVIIARPSILMTFILNASWLFAQGAANQNKLSSFWMAAAILICYLLYLKYGVYDKLTLCSVISASDDDFANSSSSYFLRKRKNVFYNFAVLSPFSFNLAWVFLAANLNIASNLFDLNYLSQMKTAIGGPDYAIGIALIASIAAVHCMLRYGDVAYVFVTIWALNGIRVNQSKSSKSDFPHLRDSTLHDATFLCIGIISVSILVYFVGDYLRFQRLKVLKQSMMQQLPKQQPFLREENSNENINHHGFNNAELTI